MALQKGGMIWLPSSFQATMLKQMVNVSSAELEGWSEQVERLQVRKQDRGGFTDYVSILVSGTKEDRCVSCLFFL